MLEGKQEGDVDARIIEILVKLKNDQVKEIAFRLLQALALLAKKYILSRLLSIVWGTIFTPYSSTIISVKKSKRAITHRKQRLRRQIWQKKI